MATASSSSRRTCPSCSAAAAAASWMMTWRLADTLRVTSPCSDAAAPWCGLVAAVRASSDASGPATADCWRSPSCSCLLPRRHHLLPLARRAATPDCPACSCYCCWSSSHSCCYRPHVCRHHRRAGSHYNVKMLRPGR